MFHCRRIIIQLFWESVNRFKWYLTNELHKTSSQTLIHIFHHFLTKRLIKNILNRTINNKIIFSCSRGTFLTVLCDKFSIMYVYVIHSDHFSFTDVKKTSRLYVIPPFSDFCFFTTYLKWSITERTGLCYHAHARSSSLKLKKKLSEHREHNNTSRFMWRTGFTFLFNPSTRLHWMCLNSFFHWLFLLFDESFCWTHTHPVNQPGPNGLKCFFFRGLKPKISTLIFSSSFNNSCWGSSASFIRLSEGKQLQQQLSLQLSDVFSCFCSRRRLLLSSGGIKSNFPELPLLSRPPTHSHTPSAGFSGASSWSRWSCSRTALAAGWWAPARRGSATGDRSGSPSGWTSAPPAAPAAPGDAAGGGSAGLSPVLYGKTWGTKDDRRKTFIVWSL